MTWRGMPPKKYRIYSMLPESVYASLPPPFTPERTRRLEEELLRVVNIPQGRNVLRCRLHQGQRLFWVERLA